ncbi:unnamed protein product, partial [marine sediment metagenome]
IKVNNNGETGKKCPKCGAGGRWYGEHETVVRNYQAPGQTIVDVGWRCWNCGWEWGFELVKMPGESGPGGEDIRR